MQPKLLQRALIALDYDIGPTGADGVWGRRSIAGLKAFQAASGLRPTGVLDAATMAAFKRKGIVLATPDGAAPPLWHAEAARLKGVREIPGAASNPVILGWAKRLGGWVAGFYANDDVPWCGLFVAHCIGVTLPDEPLPANPLAALAWSKFGHAIDKPRLGAVCVFKRPGGGHVGFYLGEDAQAIRVLGGNQQNSVTEARVPKDRLVGFRWPASVPLAGPGGPIAVAAEGGLSANEA